MTSYYIQSVHIVSTLENINVHDYVCASVRVCSVVSDSVIP